MIVGREGFIKRLLPRWRVGFELNFPELSHHIDNRGDEPA
jgi:hypothetical protein